VPNSTHRQFQSLFRKIVSLPYSRTATGLLSSSAVSVVPVANVLACRRNLPLATPRAGPSSIPTCLARSTRASRQHTVRLGRLSALPDPTPFLASSCFPWPLLVAIYRLPKSPCRMRHMEQTRRVAVATLFSKCSGCCQSTHRLCLCFLSHLPTIRHPFFSTAARDTHSRLICHPPFT
jgi:hypothetical protein